MARPHSLVALLGFGAGVAAAAWFGSRYSPRNSRNRLWYRRLDKPPFNPPDAIFPAVWTLLYALIAFSGWRTWQAEDSRQRSRALRLWVKQLITNSQWSRLFFGQHRPKAALGDVLLLETQILRYILNTKDVDSAAALAFVPYAVWVAFAAALNAEIVRRNPDAEKMLPQAA
jgi:tryptophan-rich sensory protein